MNMSSPEAEPTAARWMGLISRRYAVAGVVLLVHAATVGGVYLTFGVFVEPLEREFGWSRTEVSGALSVALLLGLFTAPIGAVADRLGPRRAISGSLFIMALGLGLRPLMTELWHFYALTALVGFASAGAGAIVTDRLIAGWFPGTRGRMLAVTGSGNQIGGLTVLPITSLVVALSGWETGYLSVSALLVIAGLLSIALVRDPERTGTDEDAAKNGPDVPLSGALRSVAFYSLMGVFVSSAMTEMVMFPQLIPHLQNEGLSDGRATAALAVVSLAGLPGKLILGRLAELWSGRRTLALSMGLIAGGTLLLAVAGGSPLVWPAVAMFGAGFGSLGVLYALAIIELFGLRSYGSILGSFKSITALAVLPVPLLAGYVFDVTGSYQLILFLATAMAAIGIPMLLFARPREQPKAAPSAL